MTRPTIIRSVLPALICLLASAAEAQEASGPVPGESTRTFYLENADVKDVVTILRSVAAIPHLAADESLAAIDVRGSADAVELAARLVAAHDRRRSDVVVDVELLELDREKLHQVGRQLAGKKSGRWMPARLSPSERERLEAGADARLLAHPTLSAASGRKAEVMIGDRVPITVDGAGTVTYQEVGFRLEVRPRVHPSAGEVTLDFELEISRRVNTSATPVIATRRITSSVRLAEGTTYFLAGLSHGEEDPEVTTEVGLALTPRISSGS